MENNEKTETVEEAAERHAHEKYSLIRSDFPGIYVDLLPKVIDDFIAGAKWASAQPKGEGKSAEGWISVNDRLPEYGTICDVWVIEGQKPHRRIDYRFVDHIGVTNKPAFQQVYLNDCGLYEMAYFLDESLITHWSAALPLIRA